MFCNVLCRVALEGYMIQKNWRIITLVLLVAAIIGIFRISDSLIYLPIGLLTLAILGLKEYKQAHFGYLLGSILIAPISLLLPVLLASVPVVINSRIDIVLYWWVIWFIYAIGMRRYFIDWIRPELRIWSVCLSGGILALIWIKGVPLPLMQREAFLDLLFIPGCILVGVPFLTWAYKAVLTRIK